MKLTRRGGILAHPTSFPSPFGIGDLGPGAYAFVDFLGESGASLWQVLPLTPTGFRDSPYQSFSTFAGNPLLISPDALLEEGLLDPEDVAGVPGFDPLSVDYGAVIPYKYELFRKAFRRFRARPEDHAPGFEAFCAEEDPWLSDYALFAAAKAYFIEARRAGGKTDEYEAYSAAMGGCMTPALIDDNFFGAAWNSWPAPLRDRAYLAPFQSLLREEICYYKFLQYLFYRQWSTLKAYAGKAGAAVIGDIPIFAAMDSADVWANPGLFQLDDSGAPTEVAGVPPDYFSPTGQLWGNPLYRWPAHKAAGYEWWIRRVKHTLRLVDVLRIDHFRGFDAYWAVPAGNETAEDGEWKAGPGLELFQRMQAELGELPIIAEDLGVITPSVEALRDHLGLPGMKVLQFAFEGGPGHIFLPHNYAVTNAVVYTGTHDNDTTAGWYEKADEKAKDLFRRVLNVSGEDAPWDMTRLALSSTAAYAVAPLQDVMGLGSEHRMNIPGTPSGNWRFRYTPDMLTASVAAGLKYLNTLFNRLPTEPEAKEEPRDTAGLESALNANTEGERGACP